MADPAFLSGTASPAGAAYLIGLIQEAGTIATAHFAQLPDGEEASAFVTLTAPTGYGVMFVGTWTFVRDAAGRVTLFGTEPEEEGVPRG
ncbi:hypothetical protein OG234_13225 [Streptomyces sp. NBC_01420]|uniref:hypothetical protein n=1 Tax=Streptomyces sp. NBC_01420 TaxID=2903858 RepID=UPI00325121A3